MNYLKPSVSVLDHIQGDAESPVVLVEYGDLQCPHCGAAHIVLNKIQNRFGSQFSLVFRHFPLAEIHPFAQIAALSTEAAFKKGKFWEMHDIIFENQRKLSPTYLYRMAESLMLNLKDFEEDLTDPAIADKVSSDFDSGIRSGVNGTPSFYINGVKYNGSYDFDSLSETIQRVLATRLLSAGRPGGH